MIVIIAGSRSITDPDRVFDAFMWYGPRGDHTIISGDASGVDEIAEDVAEEYGMDYKQYEADWDEYGKAAGPIRNNEMAEMADMLIAVWDGESQGTKNMIGQAVDHGLEIAVHRVHTEPVDGGQNGIDRFISEEPQG